MKHYKASNLPQIIGNIAEDILVYGKGATREEAENDHDFALQARLERCLKKNIKLNQRKFQFKVTSLRYILGNRFTSFNQIDVSLCKPCWEPEKETVIFIWLYFF
jgi:hypothetical protein